MGKRTRKQTPSQTVGPFFHDALVSKDCNILVNEQTRGQRIRISGKVLDGEGVPIPDALVEIWHGDRNGIYPHPHDPRVGDLDEDFRGFGRAATDDEGLYWFDTIKPGTTPSDTDSGQAPFIAVRVFARGLLTHAVTRMYFEDEVNNRDPVLNQVSRDRRATLLAKCEGKDSTSDYRFNIRLQGTHETVFFDV